MIILFGTAMGALLVASVFYVAAMVKTIRANPELSKLNTNITYPDTEGKDNYWLGSIKPQVTIVEFGDFACGFSQKSFPKVREIAAKHNDKVKIIYRDFPYLSESSLDLSMAARCAGEQGLFWPMYDKLYQNQGMTAKEDLTSLATQIGANSDRFSICINSQKYLPQIQADMKDADRLGVKGTPTWFVNGYRLEGDLPLDLWEQIIAKFEYENK